MYKNEILQLEEMTKFSENKKPQKLNWDLVIYLHSKY